ncbi:MAG: hypothetical protein N838_16600 [Thiohalocapsa sp. PB-PSB1]|jgi:hypothetical protein|nr:MAG: hypothetical protein N838_18965 [Thiohalocapsa sp. PB-PSB1]QQO54715.1 MAG: hypothetical protein N838_16600 [Thiohalocapsa sp. PB-PSB1]
MPIKVLKPLQPLAALQVRKQGLIQRAQKARVEFIKAFAKAGVAWRAFDPVEGVQIRARCLLSTVVLELQQRKILQPKQRQPRHQMIDQRNLATARVGDLRKKPPRLVQQPCGAELFA